ncbi:hypothetical protein [Shinella sp. NM-101]|uniref:hypothetical protein n=1 Tax=Shinella sp. NM-101 TaxID=2744455 RepID=UPI001F407230|nr:hypothetical protein [Shinella sp. NM-101]
MVDSSRAVRTIRRSAISPILILAVGLAGPALANNYGESTAWQFKTSADRANQGYVLDLMEKRRGGYYQAPTYNTTIERQYNCGVTATATGNADSQTALANSPSVAGATSLATGNDTSSVLNGGGSAKTGQNNSGKVSSGIVGGTSAFVAGHADQALNSTQRNSGNQTASVASSSGCTFGGAQ